MHSLTHARTHCTHCTHTHSRTHSLTHSFMIFANNKLNPPEKRQIAACSFAFIKSKAADRADWLTDWLTGWLAGGRVWVVYECTHTPRTTPAAAVVNVSPNKRWHASNDLKVNKLSNCKKYSTAEYFALENESILSCINTPCSDSKWVM